MWLVLTVLLWHFGWAEFFVGSSTPSTVVVVVFALSFTTYAVTYDSSLLQNINITEVPLLAFHVLFLFVTINFKFI